MENTSFNFGAIRDSILKLSAGELLKSDNSITLENFTTTVKESPLFKKQQLIYKNIQETKPFEKERLAERFIAQNLQLFLNEEWNNILHENKSLRKTMLNDMHVMAKKDGELFESINTLIESVTNRNFTDIEKENKAYEYVLSHLTRQVVSENEKSSEKDDSPKLIGDSWKFVTNLAVNNFNERYEHLSESEKSAFKILISDSEQKKTYFQDLKNENIQLIESKISNEKDEQTIGILDGFKQKLQNLSEAAEKDIESCILYCIELKTSLV